MPLRIRSHIPYPVKAPPPPIVVKSHKFARKSIVWDTTHDSRLKSLWGTMPISTLARRLRHSRQTIRNHAARLGLKEC